MELLILNGSNGNIHVKEGSVCKINSQSDDGIVTKISREPYGFNVYKKKGNEDILFLEIIDCPVIVINETKIESEKSKKEVKHVNRKKDRKNSGA